MQSAKARLRAFQLSIRGCALAVPPNQVLATTLLSLTKCSHPTRNISRLTQVIGRVRPKRCLSSLLLEVANDASKNAVLISIGWNPRYRPRVDCTAAAGRSAGGL